MYQYSNGQTSLIDFEQPLGMHLQKDNRWLKKTQIIPWEKIEERCALFFPSKSSNVAKPLRLALGAPINGRSRANPMQKPYCRYTKTRICNTSVDTADLMTSNRRFILKAWCISASGSRQIFVRKSLI